MSCTPFHPNKTTDVGRMDRYSIIAQSMTFTALIFIKPTIYQYIFVDICKKSLPTYGECTKYGHNFIHALKK
jgi:hypothetical protein